MHAYTHRTHICTHTHTPVEISNSAAHYFDSQLWENDGQKIKLNIYDVVDATRFQPTALTAASYQETQGAAFVGTVVVSFQDFINSGKQVRICRCCFVCDAKRTRTFFVLHALRCLSPHAFKQTCTLQAATFDATGRHARVQ
jgi:hypothetical protein